MANNLNIREVTTDDAADILAIYAEFVINTAFTFETTVPSVSDMQQRIKNINIEAPFLVCENGDEIIAYAYAGKHRSRTAYDYSRELSVYVKQHYRGKGIAKSLYVSVEDLLKKQGYANVLAGITIPNRASERFHSKFGFKQVGIYHNVGFKNGQYQHVGWWEKAIRTEKPNPIRMYDELSPKEIQDSLQWGKSFLK